VVLKTEDTALGQLLGQQAEIVYTDQSYLGMGHSLAAGFTDLNWQWAFVGLLDMPFLQPTSLEQIAMRALSTKYQIIRPVFTQNPSSAAVKPSVTTTMKSPQGHPIGIHSSLFAQVRKSGGDKGAKWLLKANANIVDNIPVSDAGIFMDIDQPKDLLQQP
jgi:CTP:molybdopterin cytidylyltransferase MocA